MAELDLRGINLRNDIIFKYVFASENSEDILISLLNAIFGHSKQELITEIIYLNPFNIKESMNDKTTVLDIRASDTNGRQYNIEMQIRNEPQFIERIIYYNSRLYSNQLKQGETYNDLKKTITIAFTDFKLFPDEKDYHNIYRLLNVKSHKELSAVVEYHFLELPKFRDSKTLEEIINKWLYTIKNAEKYINDPDKLPDTIKKEASIMRAINKMQKAAADDELRAIIEYREKAELDDLQRIKNAQREGEMRGIILGKQEGVLEGKIEVAKKMLKRDLDFDIITSVTGLTIDEVKKLMN
jgi:predicted transposase/invertase (TIGR01784 family)